MSTYIKIDITLSTTKVWTPRKFDKHYCVVDSHYWLKRKDARTHEFLIMLSVNVDFFPCTPRNIIIILFFIDFLCARLPPPLFTWFPLVASKKISRVYMRSHLQHIFVILTQHIESISEKDDAIPSCTD